MQDTVNVSWIYNFVKQQNPCFTRKTIYDAVYNPEEDESKDGKLIPVRNPGRQQGPYRFTRANACQYIDTVLDWPQGQALILASRQG